VAKKKKRQNQLGKKSDRFFFFFFETQERKKKVYYKPFSFGSPSLENDPFNGSTSEKTKWNETMIIAEKQTRQEKHGAGISLRRANLNLSSFDSSNWNQQNFRYYDRKIKCPDNEIKLNKKLFDPQR
jgi:hypothetical protein